MLGGMNQPAGRRQPLSPGRPRHAELAVALATAAIAVLAGLVILGEVTSGQGSGPALFWLDIATGALACALLPALYTRWPVQAALALAVLAAISPAATPAATAATLQVALVRRFKVAAWVAAAGAAGHAIRGLWRPQPGLSYGWWLLLVVAVQAALLAGGALVRANRAQMASLRERASRAEAEQARRVAEARLIERTRIAREMHDVLAHRLSLLATYAGALEYRPDAPPQQLVQAAAVIRDGAHQALEELRDVIGVLRDEPGDSDGALAGPDMDPGWLSGQGVQRPQPTLDDVPRLAEESRAAGTPVRLESDLPASPPVPSSTGRTAFRIAQEGLTNARKHAAGRPVQLTLSGVPGDQLTIDIRNPLPPGPPQPDGIPGSGTGLIGLGERARLAGGRIEFGPTGTGEFRLQAWLPWAP
jgi:signal transduction histidine kinase